MSPKSGEWNCNQSNSYHLIGPIEGDHNGRTICNMAALRSAVHHWSTRSKRIPSGWGMPFCPILLRSNLLGWEPCYKIFATMMSSTAFLLGITIATISLNIHTRAQNIIISNEIDPTVQSSRRNNGNTTRPLVVFHGLLDEPHSLDFMMTYLSEVGHGQKKKMKSSFQRFSLLG